MYFLLYLLMCAVIIGFAIGLSLIKAFLVHIDVINSIFLSISSVIYFYLGNRKFNAFYTLTIHPAICLLIGISIFVLTYLAQNTKIGFWIFAVLFSIAWSFLGAAIIFFITKNDMTWFWVVFGILLIINFSSHIRSRKIYLDEA